MQMTFLAACSAFAVYVVVSWLTCRSDYNLDKLLHRGPYALPGDQSVPLMSLRERFKLRNILQFDGNFTKTDKLVSGGIFWWSMLLLVVNVVVSVWNLVFYQWPIEWWSKYWLITAVGFPFLIAMVTLVWFGIGGIRDMIQFFAALRTMARDETDDGRVIYETSKATSASIEPLHPQSSTFPTRKSEPVAESRD
jgi:SSS family solute:Na+ symporter